MKTCTTKNCKQVNPQPLSNFYRDAKVISGYGGRCKVCTKEVKSKYYKLHKESENQKCRDWKKKNPDMVKAANLRHFYGITMDQYGEMFSKQNGVCAICLSDSPGFKNRKYFCVDHNHSTGKIRGLLCYPCNLAIGFLKDNPANAAKLIEYLNEEKAKI